MFLIFFKGNLLRHYNFNHTISGCLTNVSMSAETGKQGNLLSGIDKKAIRREEILISLFMFQCWTVGSIFTFGRSRMFGPEKLRPLAVGCSRSRRIKKPETYVIKFFTTIIPT